VYRDVYDVIKMVDMYEAVFRPEIIVVKSSKLKRLVSRYVVWGGRPLIDPCSCGGGTTPLHVSRAGHLAPAACSACTLERQPGPRL